jgi:hypothetical protein
MTRHGGRGTVRRPAAAFGYSLTRCSADLDDGSDDEEAGAGQVKRIGAEANRLAHRSPAPAAVATSARWRGWDGREQSGPEIADACMFDAFLDARHRGPARAEVPHPHPAAPTASADFPADRPQCRVAYHHDRP